MNKKRKRKFKWPFIVLVILVIALIAFLGKKGYDFYLASLIDPTSDAYLGSLDYKIKTYDLETFKENGEITRGTKVVLYEKQVKQIDKKNPKKKDDDVEIIYRKIKYNEKDYLVKPEYIVNTYEESVKEKEKYIRTSSTIYAEPDDVTIKSFLKKGTKVELAGFDTILDSGKVNMYKIKLNDTDFGYIYEKYLVDTEESAKAMYNENGVYDKHKGRKFSYELYGGYAANLDYYPYEHPAFEDNAFVDNAKTYYLNGSPYILNAVDKYISLGKQAGATAFVVDIKDGALAYKSPLAQKLSPSSYNTAMGNVEAYKAAVDKIKAAGFYVIGRIVTFNDTQYAKDNPNECIAGTTWVSAYSRKAWEFNVRLALEAIDLFGFNEIQYDYVRFPEASYRYSKNGKDFRNVYNEEKAQAIQAFLMYAADEIHKKHVYLSADVFGECASTYVTAYGQYWPAISNIVDVISGMPYPDHFAKGSYGLSIPWQHPYNLMLAWGKEAAARQNEIPTPAHVRTWIQAYNAIHEPKINYGANELRSQVKGLYDSGLKGGFITWNGNSVYNKYAEIAPGFSGVY